MASASYNRVILLGRLTREPELRHIPNGTPVCDIGLAVNDRRKNSAGEWIEETTFVDVTLWGRTAEVAGEYLTKASQVIIEGRLKLDSWESDGQKRSKLKVVAESMQMIGGSGGSPGSSGVRTSGSGGSRSGGASSGATRGGNSSGGNDGGGSGGYAASGGNDDVPF